MFWRGDIMLCNLMSVFTSKIWRSLPNLACGWRYLGHRWTDYPSRKTHAWMSNARVAPTVFIVWSVLNMIPLNPSPINIYAAIQLREHYSFRRKSIPREDPLLFCCIMSCPLKGSCEPETLVDVSVFLISVPHEKKKKVKQEKNLLNCIRIKEVKLFRCRTEWKWSHICINLRGRYI